MKITILFLILAVWALPAGENIRLGKSSVKKINKLLAEEYPEEVVNFSFLNKIQNTRDLYVVSSANKPLAHLIVSTAKGRYDYFDYCVLFNLIGEIQKVYVLVYRSDHGFEIMNKKWLSQFEGMKAGETKTYSKDIDAISGATWSATSITNDMNEISNLIAEILSL
ncbi:MAG: FMN-binding protein [Bacteroidetes bacterium]|nr:FMN-binding protein [Bacteroidota bacterium]